MKPARALRPSVRVALLIVAAAALLPASAQAQQAEAPAAEAAPAGHFVADSRIAPPVSPLLPARTGRLTGPVLATVPVNLNAMGVQDRGRAGPDVAMMAVGGAAVVTGLLIRGDSGVIIATGGAVVGLIALYRYLR